MGIIIFHIFNSQVFILHYLKSFRQQIHTSKNNSQSILMKMNQYLTSVVILLCSVLSRTTNAQDPPHNHKGCKPNVKGEWEGYEFDLERSGRSTSIIGNRIECVDNDANGYPCSNVHLESFISLADLSESKAFSANGKTYFM